MRPFIVANDRMVIPLWRGVLYCLGFRRHHARTWRALGSLSHWKMIWWPACCNPRSRPPMPLKTVLTRMAGMLAAAATQRAAVPTTLDVAARRDKVSLRPGASERLP